MKLKKIIVTAIFGMCSAFHIQSALSKTITLDDFEIVRLENGAFYLDEPDGWGVWSEWDDTANDILEDFSKFFPGVDIKVSSGVGSNAMVLEIPSLGINKTFNQGVNRDENEEALVGYLVEQGLVRLEGDMDGDGEADSAIFTFPNTTGMSVANNRVTNSAVDPMAGSPDSLLGSMVADDYDTATKMASGTGDNKNDGSSGKPQLGVGIETGRFSVGGQDKNLISIPLSYTHHFAKPGYKLKLSAPLSYVDTNGSKSYRGSVGAALNVPVTEKWSVIPAVRTGVVTSQDTDSKAMVNSASVASVYKTKVSNVNVDMTNMVSILKTDSIGSDDKDGGYDLSNQVFKNGITAEFPAKVNVLGKPMTVETSVANTKIQGDAVYIDNYNDFAVSLGTPSEGGQDNASNLRMGVTHTEGSHGYSGTKLNFGYSTL